MNFQVGACSNLGEVSSSSRCSISPRVSTREAHHHVKYHHGKHLGEVNFRVLTKRSLNLTIIEVQITNSLGKDSRRLSPTDQQHPVTMTKHLGKIIERLVELSELVAKPHELTKSLS